MFITFMDSAPCNTKETDISIRGAYCLHHQGQRHLREYNNPVRTTSNPTNIGTRYLIYKKSVSEVWGIYSDNYEDSCLMWYNTVTLITYVVSYHRTKVHLRCYIHTSTLIWCLLLGQQTILLSIRKKFRIINVFLQNRIWI